MNFGTRLPTRWWRGIGPSLLLGCGIHAAEVPNVTVLSDEFVVTRVLGPAVFTPRALVQTRDGYLWIGTYSGLLRFDGVQVVWFDVANTPEMVSNGIRVFHEDDKGALWIGTDDGGVLRRHDDRFESFGAAQGLPEAEVRSIGQDAQGVIWVRSSQGLFRRDDSGFRPWRASPEAIPGGRLELEAVLEEDSVPESVEPNERVAGAGRIGVNGPKGEQRRVEPGRPRHSKFHAGHGGDLWLGYRDGSVVRLDGPGHTNETRVAHFGGKSVASLHEDREGNLWVGVQSRGLYRLRRRQVTTHTVQQGLPSGHIVSILEDKAGRIWLGTFGGRLLVSEKGDLSFETVNVPNVVNTTALAQTREGQLWFGTYNGVRFRGNGREFKPAPGTGKGCRTLFEDRAGAMWVGTLSDGLECIQGDKITRYTTRDGLTSDRITCLAQDATGDLWVGTERGLNRLAHGKVILFEGQETLRRRGIAGLKTDREGNVWMGTADGGLGVFRHGQLRLITTRHGLVTDRIEDVLEDAAGHLWLPSDKGILRVNREEALACADGRQTLLGCAVLAEEDGIPVAQFGTGFKPSCLRARDGTLWFATSAGLVLVNPQTVTFAKEPLQVHVGEVWGDEQPIAVRRKSIHGPSPTRIPVGTRKLQFQFTAPTFTAPDKVQFRYRLDGIDKDWINAGNTREISYSHLAPGSYQFRVMAAGKSGIWTESGGAALAVIVLAPWWQTWWFRFVVVAGLIGLVFGGYEWRLRQAKAARLIQEQFSRRLIETQEQERQRLAGELHDSLGQSIQIIKGRAQMGLRHAAHAPETARQFEEIAGAAAQAIVEVRTISHALRPAELDQLGLAKALEWMAEQASATSATRFATEIDYGHGLCPPEIEIHLYRIAQESCNNVLKHAGASEAILELKREAGRVRLSLFDDGRGFEPAQRPSLAPGAIGLGLAGIAERVRLLGGEFQLKSAPGRGTRLTVTCPFPPPAHEG